MVSDGLLNVGEPAEVGLVEKMVHDAGIGPVVVNAEIFQFEIFVPRQHHQTAVKDRVNVMPEAGIVAVFVRVESAADFHVLFHDHDLQAALGQVTRADHAVVAGAYYHAVVFKIFAIFAILNRLRTSLGLLEQA